MCQVKRLTHQNCNPDNIYKYFRKLLKGLPRNTWDLIIANGKKTEVNFESNNLEYRRESLFYINTILAQVNCMDKTTKSFNMNVREWFKIIETINNYLP